MTYNANDPKCRIMIIMIKAREVFGLLRFQFQFLFPK